MKYMGSKRRIAKYILPLILLSRSSNNQCYVEPFAGGCNSLSCVSGYRIGADINEYIIAMWSAFQNGWLPPDKITENEYNLIKENKDQYDPALVGFVGVACTFGSKWFGTFARNKRGVNYAMEGRQNLLKQIKLLSGVNFIHSSYDALVIPNNSIIYCDIPYKNVTGYKDKFEHENFYEWCRLQSAKGHKIFVSEYDMPKDFRCIWEFELNTNMDALFTKSTIEKLFTL